MLTSVRATREHHGRAPVAEEQQVVLHGHRRHVHAEPDHGGTTYTTAALPLGADETEINAALAEAFAGLADAEVTVAQWAGTTFTLRFGGVLTGQNVAEVDVAVTPATVAAELTQTPTGSTVVTPAVPAHDLVVDYAAQTW